MIPPDERLDGRNRPGARVDDRLVVEQQVLGTTTGSKIGFQAGPLDDSCSLVFVVNEEPTVTGLLRRL